MSSVVHAFAHIDGKEDGAAGVAATLLNAAPSEKGEGRSGKSSKTSSLQLRLKRKVEKAGKALPPTFVMPSSKLLEAHVGQPEQARFALNALDNIYDHKSSDPFQMHQTHDAE